MENIFRFRVEKELRMQEKPIPKRLPGEVCNFNSERYYSQGDNTVLGIQNTDQEDKDSYVKPIKILGP